MQAFLSASSVPVPHETAILGCFRRVDLADAFAVPLPPGASRDPEVLARFLFGRQPRWVSALMAIRDAIVRPFGIKTAKAMQKSPAGDAGSRVGFFRIYDRRGSEIVLGEDDRHLDFRLAVMVRKMHGNPDRAEVLVATAVCCHNLVGRSYLALIKPFHKLIVRATLNRAARSGWPNPNR